MTRQQIINHIILKQSYLCVGLDTDIDKLPVHLKSQPNAVLLFNKAIIDATKKYCVAYKINTAFYESQGLKGWEAMEQTVNYIPTTHFKIADAKRGDIGNTSHHYAKAFFETMGFDAITIAPYMGEDSVKPFLEFDNKWTIVLGLTSNAGSANFQRLVLAGNMPTTLYQHVIKTISNWGNASNMMFVVGATQAKDLIDIRQIIPKHFLLVPGVGFQGGSLAETSENGFNKDAGLLVNASRAILYASDKEDFAQAAEEIARQYQIEMQPFVKKIV